MMQLPVPRRLLCCLGLLLLAAPGGAHDFRAGDLVIDHPYALPTPEGARTGAVYLRMIANKGRQPDRLIGARSARAASIEIHERVMDGDVMRMRALQALEIPAGDRVTLRHTGRIHLMLLDLKQPLRDGDRFTVTLQFERAGSREVDVDVHPVRDAAGDLRRHRH